MLRHYDVAALDRPAHKSHMLQKGTLYLSANKFFSECWENYFISLVVGPVLLLHWNCILAVKDSLYLRLCY